MMQKIIVLGSTGSVGKSSLEVIEQNKKYVAKCLVASKNSNLINQQSKVHKQAKIYLENPKTKITLSKPLIKKEKLYDLISSSHTDTVIAAISGSSGLELIHHSIKSGKKVLIANKEPLVMAGEFLMKEAKKNKALIIPIDSEHCSVHQIIKNIDKKDISKVTITCSGGPFYSLPKNKFKEITLNQALKHPIWKMGKKITIDSATLMNKALELIEAKYLFDLSPNEIETIIHPEGLIHSFVELNDGTLLASMANPDMKIPISYGLGYPEVVSNNFPKINLQKLKELTLQKVDCSKFPSIEYSYFAMNAGKGMPIILNAANEVAVDLFLKKKISFLEIFTLIYSALNYAEKNNMKLTSVSLESILDFNNEAKKISASLIKN